MKRDALTICFFLGYSVVICGWRSPWYNGGRSKFGQGTIAGNKCSIDCKRTGGRACALYAKCISKNQRSTCVRTIIVMFLSRVQLLVRKRRHVFGLLRPLHLP